MVKQSDVKTEGYCVVCGHGKSKHSGLKCRETDCSCHGYLEGK